MRGPHACAPEPQPRIFRIWKLRLQFRKNYQLNLQIQYFRQPKNTNEDGNNLRVQLPSVRASKENCKPILLRGTADCFDCSSGGATAATIMSARSIQLTARMAWPRRQCVRGPSKAWRPRILALVARATCSRSTTMRARAGVTIDELTPLTHGCSRRFEDRRRVHQVNTWPQSRSGSCAGAPKKPPLGRRVLSDRARI